MHIFHDIDSYFIFHNNACMPSEAPKVFCTCENSCHLLHYTKIFALTFIGMSQNRNFGSVAEGLTTTLTLSCGARIHWSYRFIS